MWATPIEKLMCFQNGKWTYYDNQTRHNYYLRFHFDQIFISEDDKLLENLSNKVKGHFKNNVLIIIFCDDTKKIRKIKFQLKADEANTCIAKLGRHIPLLNHEQLPQASSVMKPKFLPLEEVLSRCINTLGDQKSTLEMPPNYEEFVKLCILDPAFPQIVNETQKILEKITNKE